MPKPITCAWRTFRRNESGNILILFGAAIIPLLIMMGGAVDLARYARYRGELSNAVDAAVLALVRSGEDYTDRQATDFVKNYVSSFNIEDRQFAIEDLSVAETSNGYRVDAEARMQTIFLPLSAFTGGGGPINSMNMDIMSEAVSASNQIELALVLDNTGSMNCGSVVSSSCTGDWSSPSSSSRIAGLKNAARNLVNTLMTDSNAVSGYIKIGVVPFEGAVNVKNSKLDYGWLDWDDVGHAKYDGVNFDGYDIDTSNDPCTTTTTGGGRRHGGGTTTTTCTETSETVSHKWLFDQLHADNSSVQWAGCVEMRASPYDVLDTPPSGADADTLFVPFFWPDEPDSDNDSGSNYTNDYLDDDTSANGSVAQTNTDKYLTGNVSWHSGKRDTSFPYESGPNYGCPRPILPLTTDKQAVQGALDDMVAYPAMGTYIPTGLVWGWRVLSHAPPFTQGIGPSDEDYGKTVKAMVLLSDGENSVTSISNPNKSIFSAYNYIGLNVNGTYRLGSSNASTAQSKLNAKTSTLCENVKAAGIRLYTITFGDIPGAAETLMRDCASDDDGDPLYFHAPSNAELSSVFNSIGEDLNQIHLAM